jgi:hypothetical protein
MTSLEKLNVSQLPSHDAFYSTLKSGNISAEQYQLCQKVWEDNIMTTMKEFHTCYNNKDVEPMLEATDKMYLYYQNQNVDIFKDGISVSGLVLKYMFQDLPDYFTLPDEKNKDLYQLYKDNIIGGPSIVFHRYHERVTSGTGSHSSGVQNVPLASPVVCSKGRGRWHRIQ